MSARILIVDDLAPNRNLLEVKLAAEYYDVLTASGGQEALDIAQRENLDLILMDAMMPGLNGFDTCKLLKADSKTWHIPVVIVTALEEIKDRVRGLEAGADDFISKPIDDFNLMARVRSLLRLKMVTDQILIHSQQTVADARPVFENIECQNARIVLVEDQETRARKIIEPLQKLHTIVTMSDADAAMQAIGDGVDLIIVSLVSKKFDGLRLCATLRSREKSRDIPMLVIGDPEDEQRLIRAYDLGVNDTLMRPIETQELMARTNTQLRRKFYADNLRENFNQNLEMVLTDPLTGLGNRRYFDKSIGPLFEGLEERGEDFSIMVFDIDHFKRVNDILGHDMGDQVLREISTRLASNVRTQDIVGRYGGEEFMIAMPRTSETAALQAADRIRSLIGGTPIYVKGQAFHITTSVGVAQVIPGEKLRDVFKRADSALYKAKLEGRNRAQLASIKKAA